jgi:hypothetical protein
LLNNPPFLETPSACLKTAQQISPTNGVQTILILGEGVLMVFLGVDLWPVGVLQQNQAYGLTPAEIELMWQTAPPRMPIPPPATSS